VLGLSAYTIRGPFHSGTSGLFMGTHERRDRPISPFRREVSGARRREGDRGSSARHCKAWHRNGAGRCDRSGSSQSGLFPQMRPDARYGARRRGRAGSPGRTGPWRGWSIGRHRRCRVLGPGRRPPENGGEGARPRGLALGGVGPTEVDRPVDLKRHAGRARRLRRRGPLGGQRLGKGRCLSVVPAENPRIAVQAAARGAGGGKFGHFDGGPHSRRRSDPERVGAAFPRGYTRPYKAANPRAGLARRRAREPPAGPLIGLGVGDFFQEENTPGRSYSADGQGALGRAGMTAKPNWPPAWPWRPPRTGGRVVRQDREGKTSLGRGRAGVGGGGGRAGAAQGVAISKPWASSSLEARADCARGPVTQPATRKERPSIEGSGRAVRRKLGPWSTSAISQSRPRRQINAKKSSHSHSLGWGRLGGPVSAAIRIVNPSTSSRVRDLPRARPTGYNSGAQVYVSGSAEFHNHVTFFLIGGHLGAQRWRCQLDRHFPWESKRGRGPDLECLGGQGGE